MNDLEQRLREAAPYYEFPPTPSAAAGARTRLGGRAPRRGRRRPILAVALAVLAALGVAVAAIPGARAEVLHWLDVIPGVRIGEAPTLSVDATFFEPGAYGLPTTLRAAEQTARFRVRVPERLGDPDEVYYAKDFTDTSVVTLFYGNSGRPTYVLSQWPVRDLHVWRILQPSTHIERTRVRGAQALWIHSGNDAVFTLPSGGAELRVPGAIIGDILVWAAHGFAYRLETRASRDAAIAVAESLR